ncbi:MAG TPA: diadenylate cyclase CdaA [Gemmatimonadales bacterium]
MPLGQLPLPVPHWRDLVQILIVAYVIYRLLRFLAGTRALQILLGLLVLAVIYLAALLLKLSMITYLLGLVFTYGAFAALAALVVFQPELRQALVRLGQSRVFRLTGGAERPLIAHEIAEAVERLSRNATGAIIAIEREIWLDHYLESVTKVRATISADLLATIFSPYSPLHDGAVLVRGDQIVGAGCILPLTAREVTDKSLGTRHRAAVGLSEETDAMVLVVSEETAMISIARRGTLRRGLTMDVVRGLLLDAAE